MSILVSAQCIGLVKDDTPLLQPVSFDVDRGQVMLVTGSNGSGKSTLLRILAGLELPSRGSVSVRGSQPERRSPDFRATVSGLLGNVPLARDLTVSEHLQLTGASWGFHGDDLATRVRDILTDFDLTRLRLRFVHELSSGQLQLLHLALVCLRPSALLLLDEPERHLDDDRIHRVINWITGYQATGGAVVCATHSHIFRAAFPGSVLQLRESHSQPGGDADLDTDAN